MKPSNVIGIVFAFLGAFIVVTCALNWAHCNVWIAGLGCSMLTIGALIIDPTPVLTALKSLSGIASPYIPTGGRRECDPDERPKPSEPKG